jgi:hypothetical protein
MDDLRDESKAKLTTVRADVPFLDVESLLNGVERYDLFEEVEPTVSKLGVREIGNVGASRPGNDADEKDAHDDSALDAEHHQEDREEPATEDTDPHGRVGHFVPGRAHASIRVLVGLVAACQLHGSRSRTGDCANTSRVRKSNQSQVESDSNTRGKLDRRRNSPSKPLTKTQNCERNENQSFNKDSRECNFVRDQTRTVVANDSVSKVCVESHARCACNRHVCEESHSKCRQSGDGSGGRNKIAFNNLNALHVLDIGGAKVFHAFRRTDTGATGLRDNGAVDRDDVSHGEEGGQTSANFREEVRTLAFLGL